MYGLPIATERKKQLPKKAIYAKFDLTTAQREGFDADVARIDIVAVVSPVTIPALSEWPASILWRWSRLSLSRP